MSLRYVIITPERTVAEGESSRITLSTKQGYITLLPGHTELIGLLAPGEMCVHDAQGKEEFLAISTGSFRMVDNVLTLLADTAERSDELELSAIEEAKNRADAALKEVRAGDDVAYTFAAATLERELARYKVALKGRRGH